MARGFVGLAVVAILGCGGGASSSSKPEPAADVDAADVVAPDVGPVPSDTNADEVAASDQGTSPADPGLPDAAPPLDTCLCAGKACGDDGCGGTCGTCGDGEACIQGACQPLPDPECQPIATLGCGDTAGGPLDGPGSTDTVAAISCVGYDYSGPEKAFALDVPAGTSVTARVTTAEDEDDEVDVALLGSTTGACSGEDCTAQSQSAATVTTEAGTTYTALVLAFEGAVKDFELTIECCNPTCGGKACGTDGCGGSCGGCKSNEVCEAGACKKPTFAGNDTCETAMKVEALPFESSGTTMGGKDNYTFAGSACGEGQKGGLDVVFAYQAPAKQTVRAWLDDYGFGTPKIVYVLPSCADMASCLGEKDFLSASAGEALEVPLSPAQAVWFVVDGWDGTEKGAYGLHLEASK